LGLPLPAVGSGCLAARCSLGPAPASWLGLRLRRTAAHPSAKALRAFLNAKKIKFL